MPTIEIQSVKVSGEHCPGGFRALGGLIFQGILRSTEDVYIDQ